MHRYTFVQASTQQSGASTPSTMFSRLKNKTKKHTAAGSSAATAQHDHMNTKTGFGHATKSTTTGLRTTALSVEMETTALPAPAPNTRTELPSSATLPAGWTAHTTDEGKSYYHNRATNETKWTTPRVRGEQE